MTTKECLRYFHAKDFFWFGILGIFEVVHVFVNVVTFVLSTRFFFDDSRDESSYRFDHGHCWDFTAECDELSEGSFLKLFRIFFFHILLETVVYSFVSGTNKNNMI